MNAKTTEQASIWAGFEPDLFFQVGQERAEALLNLQKELLDTYQDVCRNWQTRAKSEIDAWSELAKSLTEESLQAHRQCLSQQMQLAAEDGQRMLNDAQRIVGVMTRSYGPKTQAKETQVMTAA